MQEIKITITTLSPVLISKNAGDPNMVATYNYIPARVIRGLFATEYIKRHKLKEAHRDERFYRWFLTGGLKFTDAYILFKKENDLYETYPVPLSIHEAQNDGAIYDLSIKEDISEKTKPVDKFGYISGKNLYLASVKTTLYFHHARNRFTGTSEEGRIFNYEAIDPDQSFGGYIRGDEGDIQEFLKEFKEGIYYLGRSKNNQYGKVKLSFEGFMKTTTVTFATEVTDTLEAGEITMTLLSDTIIYNEMGYPVVDVKALEKTLGCPVKKAFIKETDIEGYVSVWKLRTPSEVSFRAGSCFLLEVKDEETLERLKTLMQDGIGERREEGFGRFTLTVQDEEKLMRFTPEEKIKFQGNLPQIVQKIIIEALKNYAKERVKARAIDIAGQVSKEHLTSSLLGRLLLMLRDSKSLSDFKENKIKRLRDLAANKLKDTKIENISLYEFLVSEKLEEEIDKILNMDSLKNLDLLKNSDFKEQLCRTYLEVFLSTLIKEVKK